MINFVNLHCHHRRYTITDRKYIKLESVYDESWYGYNLKEMPYSVCLKNKKENLVLYSTLLYQFKSRKDTIDFCKKLLEKNEIEKFQEELIKHYTHMNAELEVVIQQEIQPYQTYLEQCGITFSQAMNIIEKYRALPQYLKKYISLK